MQTARCFNLGQQQAWSSSLKTTQRLFLNNNKNGVAYSIEERLLRSWFAVPARRKGINFVSCRTFINSASVRNNGNQTRNLHEHRERVLFPFIPSIQQKRLQSSGRIAVKQFHVMGPLRWLDVKAKLFLLRGFFENDFDEEEFLKGARQAVCLVSSYISKEKFRELTGLLSEKAKQDSQNIYFQETDKTKIEVKEDDIELLRISNLGFIYEENGKRWVDILVTCYCAADESSTKTIGNVEIIGLPSYRVFNFAFLREYTKGVTSNWIVNRIEMSRNI